MLEFPPSTMEGIAIKRVFFKGIDRPVLVIKTPKYSKNTQMAGIHLLVKIFIFLADNAIKNKASISATKNHK